MSGRHTISAFSSCALRVQQYLSSRRLLACSQRQQRARRPVSASCGAASSDRERVCSWPATTTTQEYTYFAAQRQKIERTTHATTLVQAPQRRNYCSINAAPAGPISTALTHSTQRHTKAYWCVPRPAVARRAWQVLRLWPRVTLPSKGSQGIILHGAYLEDCSIRGLVHFFGDGGATAYLPSAVLDSLVLRKFELRTAARPLLQVGKPDSAAATGIAPRT